MPEKKEVSVRAHKRRTRKQIDELRQPIGSDPQQPVERIPETSNPQEVVRGVNIVGRVAQGVKILRGH